MNRTPDFSICFRFWLHMPHWPDLIIRVVLNLAVYTLQGALWEAFGMWKKKRKGAKCSNLLSWNYQSNNVKRLFGGVLMVFHQGSSDGFPLRVSMIILLALRANSQWHSPVFVMQISWYFWWSSKPISVRKWWKRESHSASRSLVRLGVRSARVRLILLLEVRSKLQTLLLAHLGCDKNWILNFFHSFYAIAVIWNGQLVTRERVQSLSSYHCWSSLQTHLGTTELLLNNSNFSWPLLPSPCTRGMEKNYQAV